MSKKRDFNKGLVDMNVDDLKARIQEDEVRLKKLGFAHAITPLDIVGTGSTCNIDLDPSVVSKLTGYILLGVQGNGYRKWFQYVEGLTDYTSFAVSDIDSI